ncbi:MAG: hypothetical protein A2075_21725 [Geobacteraceae bacterium GWC2_58_44]|nr:MAG: hypothetical protein A2075_21725 [Geobacteraceae bacterium GWC2_58_44]
MGDQTAALQELKPHLHLIRDAIQQGFEQYSREYGKFSHVHDIRTKACIIRDHIVDNIKRNFSRVPQAKTIQKRGLFLLCIKRYAFRFKKLDYHLMPSNNPTLQSVGLLGQIPLPGVPSSIYLDAGYIPNSFWTNIHDIFITCHEGESISWAHSIKEEGSTPAATIRTLPVQNDEDNRKRRARPKQIPQKEEVTGHDGQG